MDRHMARFELSSKPPMSQEEAQASTVVVSSISVLPSAPISTTIPTTKSQVGKPDSVYTTRLVTGHSKPKETPSGFIETFKQKTGRKKENSKRSKSDDPNLEF